MPIVIGVRFKRTGKVYYFDPGDLDINNGDCVIVETIRGVEFGEVVVSPKEVEDAEIISPLKKVIRLCTEQDLRQLQDITEKEQEAMKKCQGLIDQHKLDMCLVDVEYTFDAKKIIFYFTADGRVDFRELVKDLAGEFKTRIELRQIGVRDEAKMKGGIGPCGREICCKSYMSDFHPVSIKMAKDQNISLNPTKISGLCGRLMCCLQYEHEFYEDIKKKIKKPGAPVMTPEGPGYVFDNIPLKEMCRVRVTYPGENVELREFVFDDVRELSDAEIEEALKKVAAAPVNIKQNIDTWDAPVVSENEQKNHGSERNGNRSNTRGRRRRRKKPAQKS